jgi:hypothetical protein
MISQGSDKGCRDQVLSGVGGLRIGGINEFEFYSTTDRFLATDHRRGTAAL